MRDEFSRLRAITSVEALSVRAAGRAVACALSFLAFGAGCAEGTQKQELSEDTLRGTGATAGDAAGGSNGAVGGMPGAGDTAMPMAGMTSSVAGMSGGTGDN